MYILTRARAREVSGISLKWRRRGASEFHINNVSRSIHISNRLIAESGTRRVKFVNVTTGVGRLSIALSANTEGGRGKLRRRGRVDDFTVLVPDNHGINPRARRRNSGPGDEFYHRACRARVR